MVIDIHTHPYVHRLILFIDGKTDDIVYSFDEEKGEAQVIYLDAKGVAVLDPNSPNGFRLITVKGKIEMKMRPGAIVPGETEESMLEEIRRAARAQAGIPEPVKTANGLCRCATECEWNSALYHLEHHPNCPVIHPRE